MVLLALMWLSFFGYAQEYPSNLDQMEHLSTEVKQQSEGLQDCLTYLQKKVFPC